jgi:hypothetical protein
MYGLLKADSELDRQEREMAMRYRQAPREQREKILAAIHETVNKHFEVRQQRRAMELKRLETELQRLREAIQRREKARKELVQRRAAELVGREDELPF